MLQRNVSSVRMAENQEQEEDRIMMYRMTSPSLDCVTCELHTPEGKVVLSQVQGTALFG
jgi:hypothetical protein